MQGSVNPTSPMGSSTTDKARETANQVGEKAHARVDRVTESAHNTIDRVASAATHAAEQFTDGRLAHTAQEWRASTATYVREHPLTAVGIAVAAGYLLSRLTSFR
jgi:ElaB/YqjD/DUF883 family membrane-anchored ribosome-binding protein